MKFLSLLVILVPSVVGISLPGTCTANQVDYFGADMPGGMKLNVACLDDCVKYCFRQEGCKSVSYATGGTTSAGDDAAGLCWLKNRENGSSMRTNSNRISVDVSCIVPTLHRTVSAAGADTCNACIKNDVDYFGADIPEGRIEGVPSLAACVKYCFMREGCKSVAYATGGTTSAGDDAAGRCWLKNRENGSGTRANSNRISVNISCIGLPC